MAEYQSVDILILGATGYTGKFVVKKFALLNKEAIYSDIRWGIAGRSLEKLDAVLEELKCDGVQTSKVSVIRCDINDKQTLTNAIKKSKVLMNCCGPYTNLSESVIQVCIETGTHYLDISAELYQMLTVYRSFNKAAEQANVLVISACGFGSIPGVMGLMHLEKTFEGVLDTVECYVNIDIPKKAYIPGFNRDLVHAGTWESMISEMENYKKYTKLKNDILPESFYDIAPEEHNKSILHVNRGKCWFPYPGPDGDIVDMTQRYLKEVKRKKPVHFKIYTTLPLFIHFIILVPLFFVGYLLSKFKLFRRLLIKYPRFFSLGYFSHRGPSQTNRDNTKYTFCFTGRGWAIDNVCKTAPSKVMTLKVSGSDPGYKTTATAFVLSAITVLKDHSNMPQGGVVTTGAAFYDTQLVNRLNENGINFEFPDNIV